MGVQDACSVYSNVAHSEAVGSCTLVATGDA